MPSTTTLTPTLPTEEQLEQAMRAIMDLGKRQLDPIAASVFHLIGGDSPSRVFPPDSPASKAEIADLAAFIVDAGEILRRQLDDLQKVQHYIPDLITVAERVSDDD